MMATATERQEFTFQAEIKQLLHLLSHSLYQSREIAIRELVSNASDALDKMRYVALTDDAHRETGPLEIVIEPREAEKELIIRDTGIGMTHDELVTNLGTIAHSGSGEFLKTLSGEAKKQADLSLIGQFGVGFYSAFMIADRVRVRTRSYKEETGWQWESEGTGSFSVSPAEEPLPRGTEIVLHLKDEAKELATPGPHQGHHQALFQLRAASDSSRFRRGPQRPEAHLGRAQEPGDRGAVHPVLPAPDASHRGEAALALAPGGGFADPVPRRALLPSAQPGALRLRPARARREPVRQAHPRAERLQGPAARLSPLPPRPGRLGGPAAERLARDAAGQHGDPAHPDVPGQERARPARHSFPRRVPTTSRRSRRSSA